MIKLIYIILSILTFTFMFLWITKPQTVTKTVEKRVEANDCSTGTTLNGQYQCEATKACKQRGGRLTHYKDTFGNSPEFECEYENN